MVTLRLKVTLPVVVLGSDQGALALRDCGPGLGRGVEPPPHGEDVLHQGYQAVQGAGRSTGLVTWSGGRARAMVVDGYVWARVPGTDVEVRALADRPLALPH